VNTYELDDHLILQPDSSNRFLVLNETAGIVWKAHRRGCSLTEICEELSCRFGISRKQAAGDVATVFRTMESAGTIDSEAEVNEKMSFVSAPDRSTSCPAESEKDLRVAYSLWGRPFVVAYGSRRLQDMLHSYLSHLVCKEFADAPLRYALMESEKTYFVLKNGDLLSRTTDAYKVKNTLMLDILAHCHEKERFGAVWHAAAITCKHACILLPAASGSGKSTLTAALIREGYGYMGDDFIVLSASGFDALAAPFALSIKETSWPVLKSLYPEIDDLPVYSPSHKTVKFLHPPRESFGLAFRRMPVHCIIHPRYVPGSSESMEAISPVVSFQSLIAANAWLDTDASNIAGFLRWLERRKSYLMTYSSISGARRLLEAVLTV